MNDVNGYFRGKVAIVTGGAAGIGLAMAENMLAYEAAAVVLVDRNGRELSQQVARVQKLFPSRIHGLEIDVTGEQSVQSCVLEVERRCGKIDLLFNNAGAGFGGQFESLTDDNWRTAFALNFYGPLYGIRAVLPIMRRQRSGHIVNIVSGIAFTPMAYQTMYAATKAALNALTMALRYELWDDGIKFTAATPGTTATNIWGHGGPPPFAQSPDQAAKKILAGVARNDRLVLGDDGDADGAANAFNPASASGMDDYLLDVARRRRKGEVAV